MYYFIKRLKHLLTASNQHGVHSPFVYDFVTECLYTKQEYSKNKSANILLKSIAYFKAETLLLAPAAEDLKKVIVQKFPTTQLGASPYDMIYSDASNLKSTKKLIENKDLIHNDTVLFVDNIHQKKTTELEWEQLKINKKVRVSIDLFYCGAVFFRAEQAKEHFKIRI